MRFKSTLDREHFLVLSSHFKLLAEQGKTAVIVLQTEVVRTIIKDESGAMQVRASLSTGALFEEFKIESRNNNTITMELTLSNLVHALKAGLDAQSVLIKLTKPGDDPFLTVTSTMVEGGADVVQHVPIRLLLHGEAKQYTSEPHMGAMRHRLAFPSPKPVSTVVDRMKVLLGSRPGGAAAAAINGNPGAAALLGAGASASAFASTGGLIQLEVDSRLKRVVFSIDTGTVAVKSVFENLDATSSAAALAPPPGEGADHGAGGAAGGSAAGLDGSGSSSSSSSALGRSHKALISVGSRHLQRAVRAITSMGAVLTLSITDARNLVVFGEQMDRSATLTFVLPMVDSGAL